MKRFFTTILCIFLVFSMIGTSTAFAAIESNAYISSFSGAVSVANDGTVTVNFGTIGTSYMDKVGASAISVYENGSWVATYYYSNPKYTATMMGTNVHYFYGYVTYSGTKGNTYQAHITHYAEKNGGNGTEDLWTAYAT